MALNEPTLVFVEIFCLFLGLSSCILLKVNHDQPEPYMDEIFHIPQVQQYCQGHFMEWDPMITTLPGLYVITVGILRPISFLFDIPMETMCSPLWLRAINIAFACGNLYLLYLLLLRLHPAADKGEGRLGAVWTATALSIFPVLYFFSFFYYTDSGSVFSVLLMYLLGLQGNHVMAAMLGALAILFRQTNVVWVVFQAATTAIPPVLAHMHTSKKDISQNTMKSLAFLPMVARHYYNVLRRDHKSLGRIFEEVIDLIWAYVTVVIGFVAFIVLNGSIVVGAKDDHQPGFHFPQLLYFAAFTAGCSCMHLISGHNIKDFLKFLRNKGLIAVLFIVTSGILVWKFTFAHKYLLSDNRHYTFYLWSKVLGRYDLIKYCLIPGYLVACWSLMHVMHHKNILWKLVFLICLGVNLVPSMLLEFRYFIIPFLILRLNMPVSASWRLAVEVLVSVAVNAVTLYLFTERPFYWPDSADKQRFMW